MGLDCLLLDRSGYHSRRSHTLLTFCSFTSYAKALSRERQFNIVGTPYLIEKRKLMVTAALMTDIRNINNFDTATRPISIAASPPYLSPSPLEYPNTRNNQ